MAVPNALAFAAKTFCVWITGIAAKTITLYKAKTVVLRFIAFIIYNLLFLTLKKILIMIWISCSDLRTHHWQGIFEHGISRGSAREVFAQVVFSLPCGAIALVSRSI